MRRFSAFCSVRTRIPVISDMTGLAENFVFAVMPANNPHPARPLPSYPVNPLLQTLTIVHLNRNGRSVQLIAGKW